ncbi:unnamed protein product [Heligmosomoides polygyrus]|uniref:Overexpressed in colon carcinoma 1 protein n=1 Tax=Heligmosomoides polygyrus TaxID=6339 RepID=A0A183G8E6_HELPZ|nr:unnamed protein product [Heligmosomoides polygyrus]
MESYENDDSPIPVARWLGVMSSQQMERVDQGSYGAEGTLESFSPFGQRDGDQAKLSSSLEAVKVSAAVQIDVDMNHGRREDS